MTTTGPVTSPAAPVRRSWSGWRTLWVILGSLLILAGGASLIGGGVGLWAHAQRDADGYHTAGPERLTTDAFALVAPSMDVNITGPDEVFAGNLLGDVRITVESTKADTPVFVGIGPAADVARYLDGVRRSEIADFDADPFTVTYVQRPGGEPTADPTAQDFWVASESGTGNQTLTWNVAGGNWSIVVMNADGSAGVDADISLGAALPVLLPASIAALVVGGLLLLIGIAIIVVTIATRPTVTQPMQPPPGPGQPLQPQPVAGQPMQSQPGRDQPMQAPPGSGQQMQASPVSGQPQQSQPGPDQPMQAQPGAGQPMQAQPAPDQQVQAQPGSGQPTQAPPGPVTPQ